MIDPDGKVARLLLVVFDMLAGCLKLVAILAPLWLPFLLIFGNTNCRGDCAVGMGMAFLGLLAVAAAFGPALLLVGAPLVGFLLYRWTRGRPVQLISAIAIIPVLIVGFWSYKEIRGTIRASQLQASVPAEYLSRSVANPVGRLEHIVLLGSTSGCATECYEVLVNGFASKYSQGYLGGQKGTGIFDKIYEISSGQDCLSQEPGVTERVAYLQSKGIFDSCIVESAPSPSLRATLLRGLHSDQGLQRPGGLKRVNVLQPIEGAVLGRELIRWEVGFLPGSSKQIGTLFAWQDLVRAYTGISSDRFAEAEKLYHSERIAKIFAAKATPLLQLRPVFSYLRTAPNVSRLGYAKPSGITQQLSDDDVTKLRAIGARICAATPTVKGDKDEPLRCIATYNAFIQKSYPVHFSRLVLKPE